MDGNHYCTEMKHQVEGMSSSMLLYVHLDRFLHSLFIYFSPIILALFLSPIQLLFNGNYEFTYALKRCLIHRIGCSCQLWKTCYSK